MVVFFDLDGTLTDPKIGIIRCIQYALYELGRNIPDETSLIRYIGPPLFGTFQTLLATADEHIVATAVAKYRERFSTVGMFENQVYPGIPAMLAALHAEGISLYIATSKPTIYAARILDHFDLASVFRRVYGSEMDGTRATKPELIRYLLHEEQIDPRDAIMVGDREHDIIGAKSNGVRSIGVLWGYGSRTELQHAGADMLCDQPHELIQMIMASPTL